MTDSLYIARLIEQNITWMWFLGIIICLILGFAILYRLLDKE